MPKAWSDVSVAGLTGQQALTKNTLYISSKTHYTWVLKMSLYMSFKSIEMTHKLANYAHVYCSKHHSMNLSLPSPVWWRQICCVRKTIPKPKVILIAKKMRTALNSSYYLISVRKRSRSFTVWESTVWEQVWADNGVFSKRINSSDYFYFTRKIRQYP